MIDHLTEPGWRRALGPEFSKPYFKSLLASLEKAKNAGEEVRIFSDIS